MDEIPGVALKRKADDAESPVVPKRAKPLAFAGVGVPKAGKAPVGRTKFQKVQQVFLDRLADVEAHDRKMAKMFEKRAELSAKLQVASANFDEAVDKIV